MRHQNKINHLGRTKSHRDALMANMTISLILHKRIFTTLAKAKALRPYAEHLVNVAQRGIRKDAELAKNHTDANVAPPKDHATRRLVFSYLQNKHAVTELFSVVAPKVGDRPGGYTRILKTGNRLGDNAKTCFIELVDFNEGLLEAKEQESSARRQGTRRSRRSKKSADKPAAEAAATAEE